MPSSTAARACARSFAACASRSPLVKSALCGLVAEGALPLPDGLLPDEGWDALLDGSVALQWALAQLLALHLRAGLTAGERACCCCCPGLPALGGLNCPAALPAWRAVPHLTPPLTHPPTCAATEGSILAALWLLEAAGSKERESASAALCSYLHHISLFCPVVRAAAASC